MTDGSSDLACGGCESFTEPIEKTKVVPFIVTLASMAYAMVRRPSTYTERVSDSLSIMNTDDGRGLLGVEEGACGQHLLQTLRSREHD